MEYKVINRMADGSICEDLSTYLDTHELPETAARLIVEFMQEGRRKREERERAKKVAQNG